MYEYREIKKFYTNSDGTPKRAKRSGIAYINHIDEGLKILNYLGANKWAKKAYCLHPIFQEDKNIHTVVASKYDGHVVMLAMEYRHVANAHLSFHDCKIPSLSVLPEVNGMLRADKLQNYKDFRLYYQGDKKERLEEYFMEWFKALDIYSNYQQLYKEIFHESFFH